MAAIYLNTKELSKIFTCRRLNALADITARVLPYGGSSGAVFLECVLHGGTFLVKLTFADKSTHPPMMMPPIYSPTDTEIQILKLLKTKIIDANISPCIIEIYYSRSCTSISKYVSDAQCKSTTARMPQTKREIIGDIFCDAAAKVRAGLAYDKFAFVLLERCDMTLDVYIRQCVRDEVSYVMLKSFLFQIIHALYAITRIYPRFRHNDLHANNVLLKIDRAHDSSKPSYLSFGVEGTRHCVPYFGVVCKIIDFGMSAIPEENIVSSETTVPMKMFYNVGSDILILFYDIHRAVYNTMLIEDNEMYNRVTALLDSLEPARLSRRLRPENIQEHLELIPTYARMLANDVFSEYRNIASDHIHHEYTKV